MTPAKDSRSGPVHWQVVERTLDDLARVQAELSTVTGKPNRIVGYEPGRRVRVQTMTGTNWVYVDWIKDCWATLERERAINGSDVRRPGRRSAFMMALFRLVPGVREHPGRPFSLTLDADRPPGHS